jgi:hypothetical protein
MMNLVNGFVCANCTDVELAKRGVDPAHPQRGVQKAQGGDDVERRPALGSTIDEEVQKKRLGENRPLTSGEVGTRLNLFA